MKLSTPTLAPLLLAAACQLGPDAREVASGEALGLVSHIQRQCDVALQEAAPILEPGATELEAVSRYTLNASEQQEACVHSAVDTYDGSASSHGGCTVVYSYPRGWTKPGGGMRMGVAVDCLPYYLE